jgi:uncharacterized membrane protein
MFKLYGLLPLFAAVTLVPAVGLGDFGLGVLALWTLIPYALLPFTDILSLPKIRLVQIAISVPMTFCLTYILYRLNMVKRVKKLFIPVMVVIITGNLILAVRQYAVKRAFMASDMSSYLPGTMLDVFSFMDRNLPPGTPVLSYEYHGIAIPSFTRQVTYFGQMNHTKDFFRKKDEVVSFFGQTWDAGTARKFLRDHGIMYVYFGEHERRIAGKDLAYPFLERVYGNTDVTLFAAK